MGAGLAKTWITIDNLTKPAPVISIPIALLMIKLKIGWNLDMISCNISSIYVNINFLPTFF